MFKLTRWMITVFFVLAISATGAFAQATRTWVSGVGDDANPCSRTAPCKTFAGAISKTAPAGEISVLDPGGFGAVTITKSITLDGGGGPVASILASGVNGVVINVPASSTVILRNLYINGAGTGTNGIHVTSGGKLLLDNIRISGFTQNGINFIPNAAATLSLEKTTIYNTGTSSTPATPYGGLYVKPSSGVLASATINGSNFSNNNGFGVKAADGARLTINNSVAGNNGDAYVAASTAAAAEITLTRSVASGNTSRGIVADGSLAAVYLTGTTVTHNDTGIVSANGGDVISHGSNSIMGNTTTDGAPTSYLPLDLGPLVIY